MKIAVVNSRKPRAVHPDEPWLSPTMALGFAITRAGHTLCASAGSIGYDAALFGAARGRGKIEAFISADQKAHFHGCLPADTPTNLVSMREIDAADSHRDQVVLDAADVVIAVAIRAGGQMESLLEQRLRAGKRIQVVCPVEQNAHWRGTQKLRHYGAPLVDEQLWSLAQEQMSRRELVSQDEPMSNFGITTWQNAPLSTPTLSHFTRAADGPWPGQTYAEYLDDLWFGGARARRDAEATLARILRSRVLEASPRLIRGRFPVVSFTAVSPDKIHELLRFRTHLARWDFQPWGIIFDRDWLVKRRARPVQYLPSASFAQLALDERPFFQKHEPPASDYSQEQEWRVMGDVDFSDVPQSAIRVFLGS